MRNIATAEVIFSGSSTKTTAKKKEKKKTVNNQAGIWPGFSVCDHRLSREALSLSVTFFTNPGGYKGPFHILCLGNWLAMKTYSVSE